MKNNIAPLVIFSFNRPNKIKKLFKSLKKNRLSKFSKIGTYSNIKSALSKKIDKKGITKLIPKSSNTA